jgi:hypothetical protein
VLRQRARAEAPAVPGTIVAAASDPALAALAALRLLKQLLDEGVLTREEFEGQKAALLRPGRTVALLGLTARVVGCPQCQAKLRVRRPGVVQCPRCRAKVRAGEHLFAAGAGGAP